MLENINILVLGLNGSGKTEICHVLSDKKRTDMFPTNGLRLFARKIENFAVTFTEIGGNEGIRNIWHHYYPKAHAIIYVVDLADEVAINESYDVLSNVIKHRFIQGKSILVLANKTDLCEHPDILDFYERFPLETLANFYQSHILLQCCGHNDYTELYSGIDWLRHRIEIDLQHLKNRISFDIESGKNQNDSRSRIRRLTSMSQVRGFLRRPRSAPSVATSSARAKQGTGSFSRSRRLIRKNRVHSADQGPNIAQQEVNGVKVEGNTIPENVSGEAMQR
ncbi:unnamed protein product [Hermetia illucens]|uniref:ADP-ribosylation factor-like protein 13B n=2 Tax=Hermetia illucens TaxID=343691 RepID=A0A7R8Z2Y1_HERIL|nr:unnamed protein product [Hermetia illucens]